VEPTSHVKKLPAVLILSVGLACSGADSERRFASLGTAGTGGIYYPLGGAIARMVGEAVPGLQMTAEVTGGSVENLNRVASGEMDVGMAIGTTLALAATTSEEARYAALRIVAPLYPNVTHILARPGAEIVDLGDAAGASVSIGAPGSGTEQLSRELLAAHDLTTDDITARYLSFAESASALRDGAIDVAVFSVGYPAASVLEATTTGGVRLLALGPEPARRMIAAHDYYVPATIPAGAYPGVDGELDTVAVMNWIFARDTLSDEIVVAILDALRTRIDELATVNDVARQISLEALAGAPLPLHAATEAWLRTSPPETR
jgi:TRAP transporter TAXI family solute receptor